MAILEGSRYEYATVVRVIQGGQQIGTAAYSDVSDLPDNVTYTIYTVQYGDRLDLIAHRNYGDAELWNEIALANPQVFDHFVLTPGSLLRIPEL